GHDSVRVRAAGERLPVLAVGRHQVVGLAERLGRADDRRLLADAEVEEAADEEHLLEDREAGLLVRQAVLDLAEADLLEPDYVARPVAPLSVFSLRRSSVSRLRGVTCCHWSGGYPSVAAFNSRFPRLGGFTPLVGGFG